MGLVVGDGLLLRALMVATQQTDNSTPTSRLKRCFFGVNWICSAFFNASSFPPLPCPLLLLLSTQLDGATLVFLSLHSSSTQTIFLFPS